MKKNVQKSGQKFKHYGRVLTAKSFFGPDGIPYQTAEEARKAHPKKMICVGNEEYDGATNLAKSFLIE